MAGSVFQRRKGPGRPWTIKYEGSHDPLTGKRRPVWKGGFATKRAATLALNERLAAVGRGEFVPASKQTFSAFLEEWLAARASALRPTTLTGYTSKVRGTICPLLGHIPLQELDARTLNRFYAACLDGAGIPRPLSPATVRQLHAIIGRALSDAERWGYVTRNVARQADAPRSRPPAVRPAQVWAAEEVILFAESLGDDPDKIIFDIAVRTGMRRGEILGLVWSDVDLEARTIRVRQQLVSVNGTPLFSDPKSSASRRHIDISDDLAESLRRHRRDQLAQSTRCEEWADLGLVICSASGSPRDPDSVSKWFQRRLKSAGAKRIKFHDLRHTHASLLFLSGTDAKVISARLGHSSVAFTLDTYVHIAPAQNRGAADDLERALAGARGGLG